MFYFYGLAMVDEAQKQALQIETESELCSINTDPENACIADYLRERKFFFPEMIIQNDLPVPARFNIERALALMQCSALTYCNPNEIHEISKKWEIPYIKIFDHENSRAVLFGGEDYLIIAFRGSDNFKAIVDSVRFPPTQESVILGEPVHGGFFEYLDAKDASGNTLWNVVEQARKNYLAGHPSAKVFMTGHSLGGSVALLGAGRLLEKDEDSHLRALYTFGQSRVAGEGFISKIEDKLKQRYFRVINKGDGLAKHAPFLGGFIHPEHQAMLFPNGTVTLDKEIIQEPSVEFPELRTNKSLIDRAIDACNRVAKTHTLYHKPINYIENLELAVLSKNQDAIPETLISNAIERARYQEIGPQQAVA